MLSKTVRDPEMSREEPVGEGGSRGRAGRKKVVVAIEELESSEERRLSGEGRMPEGRRSS